MTSVETGYPKSVWGRGALIVLVGPIFGALAMFVAMVAVMIVRGDLPSLKSLAEMLALHIIFGWMAGVMPATVSAIIWLAIERRVRGSARRSAVAAAIGALTGAVLVWPVIFYFAGPYAPGPLFALPAALAGAVGLVLAAGAWHETPERTR